MTDYLPEYLPAHGNALKPGTLYLAVVHPVETVTTPGQYALDGFDALAPYCFTVTIAVYRDGAVYVPAADLADHNFDPREVDPYDDDLFEVERLTVAVDRRDDVKKVHAALNDLGYRPTSVKTGRAIRMYRPATIDLAGGDDDTFYIALHRPTV